MEAGGGWGLGKRVALACVLGPGCPWPLFVLCFRPPGGEHTPCHTLPVRFYITPASDKERAHHGLSPLLVSRMPFSLEVGCVRCFVMV